MNPIADKIKRIEADADKGLPIAQATLGGMYLKGKGKPRDANLAFSWYMKAAVQGNANAQEALRHMYLKGIGVKPDPDAAFKWARIAAENGSIPSQYNLGVFYWKGLGVSQDSVKSYFWFSIARLNGYRRWRHRLSLALVRWSLSKQELEQAEVELAVWRKIDSSQGG